MVRESVSIDGIYATPAKRQSGFGNNSVALVSAGQRNTLGHLAALPDTQNPYNKYTNGDSDRDSIDDGIHLGGCCSHIDFWSSSSLTGTFGFVFVSILERSSPFLDFCTSTHISSNLTQSHKCAAPPHSDRASIT